MNSETNWTLWEGALVLLNQDAFMSLMRHYLPTFSTPFNKQQLIRDLKGMLKNGPLRQKIRELLDQQDLLLLSAIETLEKPTLKDLIHFVGDNPGFEIREKLLNLEERLLIFKTSTTQGLVYFPSPFLLEPDFMELMQKGKVFEAKTAEGPENRPLWLTSSLLAAFLGFVIEGRVGFTQNRKFRKKTLTEWAARIPGEILPPNALDVLHLTAATLRIIRVAGLEDVTQDEVWEVDDKACDELAQMPEFQRNFTIWVAAMGVGGVQITQAAYELKAFLASIPPTALLADATLMRWISFLALDESLPGGPIYLLNQLTQLGHLIQKGPYYQVNQACFLSHQEHKESWTLQPNFELFVPQEGTLQDQIFAARIGEFCQFGPVLSYKLTKISLHRAFGRNLTAQEILEELESRIKGTISQNLRFSIVEWEKEYRSLQLYRGLVMCVDEFRRPLIEHSQGFRNNLLKELAPGVFLVRDHGLDAWNKELQTLGLPPLPSVQNLHAPQTDTFIWDFKPWKEIEWTLKVVEESPSQGEERRSDPLKEIRQLLEDSPLTPSEKDEILPLLERKLILLPHQMTQRSRNEKMEAKGIDYQGKIRLAEQAIRNSTDLLEIILRDDQGNPIKHLLQPVRIEKDGQDLYLHGKNLSTGILQRFSLGKISLLKRIRTSLLSGT